MLKIYAIIKADDKPTTPMYRQIRSDVVIFLINNSRLTLLVAERKIR